MSENTDSENTDFNDYILGITSKEDLNNDLIRRQEQQDLEIEEKKRLLETRNRMLQLSYEQNNYKKKLLLTLLSVILAVFVFLVVMIIKKGSKK